MKDKLRIALPGGRMSEEALSFFIERGLTEGGSFAERKLVMQDTKANLEFLSVRSKDVGTYVEQGAADLGVIGHDLLEEHAFEVFIPAPLPFGECRLAVAYPPESADWEKRRNLRVATKYVNLAGRFFFENGFNAQIVQLYGSIEIAPFTGMSDVIVDLVSTGATLKANNLVEGRGILESSARLIVNPSAYVFKRERINSIIEKLS